MELRQKPSPLGKVAERSEVGRDRYAVRIRRNTEIEGKLYRTSPGPFGATLPKGEGMSTPYRVAIISGVMFSSKAMTISTDFSKS